MREDEPVRIGVLMVRSLTPISVWLRSPASPNHLRRDFTVTVASFSIDLESCFGGYRRSNGPIQPREAGALWGVPGDTAIGSLAGNVNSSASSSALSCFGLCASNKSCASRLGLDEGHLEILVGVLYSTITLFSRLLATPTEHCQR